MVSRFHVPWRRPEEPPRTRLLRGSAARDPAPRDSAPRDPAPRNPAPRDSAPRDSAPRDLAARNLAARAVIAIAMISSRQCSTNAWRAGSLAPSSAFRKSSNARLSLATSSCGRADDHHRPGHPDGVAHHGACPRLGRVDCLGLAGVCVVRDGNAAPHGRGADLCRPALQYPSPCAASPRR
jgi:hypothetical protein